MDRPDQWDEHHEAPESIDHGRDAREQLDQPSVGPRNGRRRIVMTEHRGQDTQRCRDQDGADHREQGPPQHRREIVETFGGMPGGIGQEPRDTHMPQDRKRFHDEERHDQKHDRSRDRGDSSQEPEQEPVSRPAGQSIAA